MISVDQRSAKSVTPHSELTPEPWLKTDKLELWSDSMVCELMTGPEHQSGAANDDHYDNGKDAGSVQHALTTILTEINYPMLPHTSLTAEGGQHDSFYICEENNTDGDNDEEDSHGDSASELDIST